MNNYKLARGPTTAYYIPDFININEEKEIINKINLVALPKWTQLTNRRLQNWGGLPHPKGMIAEELPQWLQKYMIRIGDLDIFDEQHKPNHVLINEYKAGQGIMPHFDGPLFYPIITTISCGSHTLLEFCKKKNLVFRQEEYYDLILEERLKNKHILRLRHWLDPKHYPDFYDCLHLVPEDLSMAHCKVCFSSFKLSNRDVSTNWDSQIESSPAGNVESEERFSILVEPRSLLILNDSMYYDYQHSIAEVHADDITDSIINLSETGKPYTVGDTIERSTRYSLTIRHVPKTTKLKIKLGR